MKSTDKFKETIQEYLNKRAEEDVLFAETLKKPNKNIDGCINYILQTVQKSGCSGFADSEIFGMAVHYYDEDSISNKGNVNGNMRVVVNHTIELTEEEKAAAKQKAMDLAIEEAKEEARKKLAEDIQLNDQDVDIAKQIAIQKIVEEQKEKLVQKKEKKVAKKETTEKEVQQDLFSM